jgi:hypothetical protein
MKLSKLLKESVTISVKTANEEYPNLKTILDISFAISRKAVWPIIEKKFTPSEKETFRKVGTGADVLTTDGFDFNKPTGILNFYVSGIPIRYIKDIIKNIKDEANDLGLTLGKLKVEKSNMYKSKVIRIPIVKNPWINLEHSPEFNISNRNFQIFFSDVLGLVSDSEYSFSLPIEKIEKALAPFLEGTDISQMKKLKPHVINPGKIELEPKLPGDEWKSESQSDAIIRALGGNAFDMGLTIDQLSRYIQSLNELVQWAKNKGYKIISAS